MKHIHKKYFLLLTLASGLLLQGCYTQITTRDTLRPKPEPSYSTAQQETVAVPETVMVTTLQPVYFGRPNYWFSYRYRHYGYWSLNYLWSSPGWFDCYFDDPWTWDYGCGWSDPYFGWGGWNYGYGWGYWGPSWGYGGYAWGGWISPGPDHEKRDWDRRGADLTGQTIVRSQPNPVAPVGGGNSPSDPATRTIRRTASNDAPAKPAPVRRTVIRSATPPTPAAPPVRSVKRNASSPKKKASAKTTRSTRRAAVTTRDVAHLVAAVTQAASSSSGTIRRAESAHHGKAKKSSSKSSSRRIRRR